MATRRTDLDTSSSPASAPAAAPTPSRTDRDTRSDSRPRSVENGSRDPSPFSDADLAAGESREERIARAAYQRAERRGFAPGGELDDWLAAERDIDAGA